MGTQDLKWDGTRVWELEKVEAESRHTFGHISNIILVVLAAAVPGHVIHSEGLVGAQHDHFDGTRLQQHDLVLRGEISVVVGEVRRSGHQSRPSSHTNQFRVLTGYTCQVATVCPCPPLRSLLPG